VSASRTDTAADSPLVAARRARAANTHQRALTALRQLIRAREPVTFAAVAARAGVSREYLYRHLELASKIRAARTRYAPQPVEAPSGEQPVLAALRDHVRRLDAEHHDQLAALRRENEDLRRQLETALGRLLDST